MMDVRKSNHPSLTENGVSICENCKKRGEGGEFTEMLNRGAGGELPEYFEKKICILKQITASWQILALSRHYP